MLLALLIILVHQALTVVIHVEAMGACENVHDSRGAARVQQQWQCDAFVGCWANHVIDFILRESECVRVGVSKFAGFRRVTWAGNAPLHPPGHLQLR